MDSYIPLIAAIIVIVVLLKLVSSNASQRRKVFKNGVYKYTAKPSLMTPAEMTFFRQLELAVNERYLVFPQVHLSALLDHRVKGQDWKFAFRHVNGKSVDYVLCDRETLQPAYAIELDDHTHDRKDRIHRDTEVERIFEEAQIPLVRFRDIAKISKDSIIQSLIEARKL